MTVEALASSAISALGSEQVEVAGDTGPRIVRGFVSGVAEQYEGDRLSVGVERLMLTTSLEDGRDLELDSTVLARGGKFKVTAIYPSRISYTFHLQAVGDG